MIEVRRRVNATPDEVFEVLSNGWLYSSWVVGASRMRAVDEAWPQPGSRLHHSAGIWPAVIDDTTVSHEAVPGRRLVMTARGWPVGEARIDIQLEPDGADATTVILREDVSAGPTQIVPRPIRALAIKPRNIETLRRLAYIAERRTGVDAEGG